MTPTKLRAARKAAGLTQREAGALVFASAIQFSQWESGYRNMPRAKWELWKLRVKKP
jgi:transcriptional regulator with XRE-family HTH domain